MRIVAAAALAVLLGGCWPIEEAPLDKELAGWWHPEKARNGCDQAALRFDKSGIRLRRGGTVAKLFDFETASAQRGEVHLVMKIAEEVAAMAARETRQAAIADLMPRTRLRVTLRVSGNRMIASNLQIEDPGRGLRAPTAGESRGFGSVFSLVKCA